LVAGLPVIATKGAPWSGLVDHGCGWWIEVGAEPLVEVLNRSLTLPREHLDAMGLKGRTWMQQAFSWSRVAQDMLAVYRWLSGAAPAPDTVRFA